MIKNIIYSAFFSLSASAFAAKIDVQEYAFHYKSEKDNTVVHQATFPVVLKKTEDRYTWIVIPFRNMTTTVLPDKMGKINTFYNGDEVMLEPTFDNQKMAVNFKHFYSQDESQFFDSLTFLIPVNQSVTYESQQKVKYTFHFAPK